MIWSREKETRAFISFILDVERRLWFIHQGTVFFSDQKYATVKCAVFIAEDVFRFLGTNQIRQPSLLYSDAFVR